jgi:DHA2 family multidrug resistance protein
VDLPYLRKWNTVLLGFALFIFRFVLLATIMIIPQSLAVRGLDAGQYGSAVVWSAVGEIVLAFIGAFFLNKGIDTRLLMAIGFASIAFACVINADFTSVWAPENYFRSELLMALGQSFAMLGLVSSIILQAAFSGGLDAPQRALTFSAFFHTIRLFGGQTGALFMGHYLAEREKLHSNLLGLHVQSGQWITADTLRHLAAGMAAKSSGSVAAAGRAFDVIEAKTRLQAYSLSFIDAFHFIAWICAVMLLVTAVLRQAPISFGQLEMMRQEITPTKESKS